MISTSRYLFLAVISWLRISVICYSDVQRIEVREGRYHSCSRSNSDKLSYARLRSCSLLIVPQRIRNSS